MENKQTIKEEYPKIMVFSHNCFSKSGSNGRTLSNLLIEWPNNSLAQFYINNELPDSPVCNNYYRVLDTEALEAFYKGSRVGKIINSEMENYKVNKKDVSLNTIYNRHRNRKSFNYIIRNLIWDSNKWRGKGFKKWVDDFNPDIILLQVGDYAFMMKIALSVAKKQKIPIVLYNSEDYYFKDKKSFSLLYRLYRSQYKRQFEKLIKYSSHTVYICDMLQETYNKKFNHKSSVIMTATEVIPFKSVNNNEKYIISYLGNLSVGRHESLIELANTLQSIDGNFKIDVYGKIPNKEVEKALLSSSGIRLKGFISYDEVTRVMNTSNLLVHAENFSDFYKWDLKHAFSTKIADSLASGTCFFVYAPENMASSKYLIENKAACVVTDSKNLFKSLVELIENEEQQRQYVNNALSLVKLNHSKDINNKVFKEIIDKVGHK